MTGALLAATPTPSPKVPTKRGWAGYLLLLPALLWLGLFFVLPLFSLMATSLYDPSGSLEDGYAIAPNVQNYVTAMRDYFPIMARSTGYALAATISCILLGFPLAYAIAFKAGRWKNLMLVAVIAPFFTSFLIRTLSWQVLLGDHAWFVQALRSLHLIGPDAHLLATPLAVITGLTYNFLPFMVLPLYASLEKIDGRLIEAGADLYASPITTFRTVTVPLAMPGLVAGTLLTFIPATGDYINAELLGNPKTQMIGNVIQHLFDGGSYPEASALSVILMGVIVVLVLLYIRRAGTEELL